VNTCRGIGLWAVRAAAVFLLATGVYLVLKRVALAVISGERTTAFFAWGDPIGESQSFYRGIAMILIGAALGLASPMIARWVFAAPPTTCPRCGYERVEQDRCPECGLTGFNPPPPA
jgi:hypothetical protein